MDMSKMIEMYITSKASSWSASTARAEGYRLRGITLEMLTNPETLWVYLTEERKLKPYSVKTTFIRAGELLDFLISKGKVPQQQNALKIYMREFANKFKNSYIKRPVNMTWDEMLERISKIENDDSRAKALQLAETCTRFTESTTLNAEGQVIGKGGMTRTVPNGLNNIVEYDKTYQTFWRHLKAVGLKPHTIRKVCATKMRSLGASTADLMAMFGWKSSQTASIYEQAEREGELAKAMREQVRKDERHEVTVSKKVRKAK